MQLRAVNERTVETLASLDGSNSLASDRVSNPCTYEDTVLGASAIVGTAEKLARTVEDSFLSGVLGAPELPDQARVFYWLGEQVGQRSRQAEIEQLKAEVNRLYRLAFSEREPMKPGVTFSELLRRRGEHDRAARVDADMAALRFELGVDDDIF